MSTSDPDKTPRRGLGARRKERIDELAATSGTAAASARRADGVLDQSGRNARLSRSSGDGSSDSPMGPR